MSKIFEEQIDDIFADFINNQAPDHSIKELYDILPFATHHQQKIIVLYRTLAKKYNSPVLTEMAQNIERLAQTNRKLGFTFTKNIEAYSLYKHFKGYKASSSTTEVKG